MWAMENVPALSKSRIVDGLQCPKKLYFRMFRKELIPENTIALQHKFDNGNDVGERAQEEFPSGVLIDNEYWDIEGGVRDTAKAIAEGALTIYEASFMGEGIYARVDVLRRERIGAPWEVIEVKAANSVKSQYIADVAAQALALEHAGIQATKFRLMHLNRQYIYPGPGPLFCQPDVTADVLALKPKVADRIAKLKAMVEMKREPNTKIGKHCEKPYPCDFKYHCFKDFPKRSVHDVPGIGPETAWALIGDGKILIEDLNPEDFADNIANGIRLALRKDRTLNTEAIHKAIAKWKWPLYFLDFETLMPAIPRYDGCNPYGSLPFQFSCHVWKSPEAPVEHFELLHLEKNDPRPAIAKALVEGLGTEGTILAYSASAETGTLKKLAKAVPEYSDRLLALIERVEDPQKVIQRHVYFPEFNGGFSLKDVAPAILGEKFDYSKLAIGSGEEAQAIAEAIMLERKLRRPVEQFREELLIYCRQDTLALVELVRWMRAQ